MRRKKTKTTRPVQVRYYDDPNAMPDDHVRVGNCRKEIGVLRGAMIRIMLGERAMARVYKDGINIMTVRRRTDGLPELRFGPHVIGEVRPDGSIRYLNERERPRLKRIA